MNQQTTYAIPDHDRATLTLPRAPTLDTLWQLEDAIGRLLRAMRSDLRGSAGQDPASIEFESWFAHEPGATRTQSGENHV